MLSLNGEADREKRQCGCAEQRERGQQVDHRSPPCHGRVVAPQVLSPVSSSLMVLVMDPRCAEIVRVALSATKY